MKCEMTMPSDNEAFMIIVGVALRHPWGTVTVNADEKAATEGRSDNSKLLEVFK